MSVDLKTLTPDTTLPTAGFVFGADSQVSASPSVYSTSAVATTVGLQFPAGAAATPSISTTGDNDTGVWFPAANTVAVSTNATERIRITSDGLVGVGTSSPAAKLHTTLGTSFSWGGVWNSGVAAFGGSTGAAGAFGISYNDTDGAGLGTIVPGVAWKNISFYSNELIFNTNGVSERMRINSAGNVGIGTSGPSAPLTVKSESVTYLGIRVLEAAGVAGSIQFVNDPVSAERGSLIATASGNMRMSGTSTAEFYTNALERMRIDVSGNVGIGTSSPVNKLQISGSFGRGAPVTKTADFTLAHTENWLICNGTATVTVTLPAASSWTGRELTIKTIAAFTVISASSNVVPLDGSAAGTAILAATAGKWSTLVSDGTNWVVMAGN